MAKDQKNKPENSDTQVNETITDDQNILSRQSAAEKNEEVKQNTPEEKITELEDKVARAFAEMENQRRRFEKERDDAFSYGGFAFAKETLN